MNEDNNNDIKNEDNNESGSNNNSNEDGENDGNTKAAWFLQCLSSQSPLSPPQIKAVGFPPLLLNALEQVIQFKFLLCLIVYIFVY